MENSQQQENLPGRTTGNKGGKKFHAETCNFVLRIDFSYQIWKFPLLGSLEWRSARGELGNAKNSSNSFSEKQIRSRGNSLRLEFDEKTRISDPKKAIEPMHEKNSTSANVSQPESVFLRFEKFSVPSKELGGYGSAAIPKSGGSRERGRGREREQRQRQREGGRQREAETQRKTERDREKILG